ncbi:MAG: hypothetical protein HYX52_05610 [Chloroflexi bacterium]|nr:hypothetical protein [Chloroflexota bacterium]
MQRTLSDVVNDTFVNHGGTFDAGSLLAVQATHGFAVSFGPAQVLPLDDLTPNVLAGFLANTAPQGFLGTWVQDGLVHLDRTVIAPSLDIALRVAELNGQRAVYDFSTGQDILVRAGGAPLGAT